MKTAVCYYSRHHGNTLKVDAFVNPPPFVLCASVQGSPKQPGQHIQSMRFRFPLLCQLSPSFGCSLGPGESLQRFFRWKLPDAEHCPAYLRRQLDGPTNFLQIHKEFPFSRFGPLYHRGWTETKPRGRILSIALAAFGSRSCATTPGNWRLCLVLPGSGKADQRSSEPKSCSVVFILSLRRSRTRYPEHSTRLTTAVAGMARLMRNMPVLGSWLRK